MENQQLEKRVHTDKFGTEHYFTATFIPERKVTAKWGGVEKTVTYPAHTFYHIFRFTKTGALVEQDYTYTTKWRAEKKWADIITR